MKRRAITWKWAHGNKRQKKKARLLAEVSCGCQHCAPEDRRDKLTDRFHAAAEAER